MFKASIVVIMLILTIVPVAHAADPMGYNSRNYGNRIDKATAVKIAVQEWERIYGKTKIENESPYQAVLKNDVWYVAGSLPDGRKGGVAEAEISADDGRIMKIRHGK